MRNTRWPLFRDEDLRADKQPEFTQLDIEMSFIDEEDIMELTESMLVRAFADGIDREVSIPFPRITYDEAMKSYGSDKPDMRFGLIIQDLTDLLQASEFKVFATAINSGGVVRAINAPGCASLSRKEIDELVQQAIDLGARGLAWIQVTEEGMKSPIVKFISPRDLEGIASRLEAKPGDLLLFCADFEDTVARVLGGIRLELGRRLQLIDEDTFNCLGYRLPLLEWDEEENRYSRASSLHFPIGSRSVGKCAPIRKARAYDLV